MNFIPNPSNPSSPAVQLTLSGGMIFQAPLGIVGDVTGANITDVEIDAPLTRIRMK